VAIKQFMGERMGDQLQRFKRRQEALRKLRSFEESGQSVLLIHYSCESFYDRPSGSTPRITSIAIRNLASAQTDSFSIHKTAELRSIAPALISAQYDALEKEMLSEFFEYLHTHLGFTWVHWNMRDINFGFQAIEHRFKVLGGIPKVSLPEERKFDLARALVSIYGRQYCGHPRLESIVKINKITDRDFLNGPEEAAAFDDGEYVKLHQSTLRKVDIFANIFERTLQGSLKTQSTWLEAHAFTPKIISEILSEHWPWAILIFAIAVFGVVSSIITIKDHYSPKPTTPIPNVQTKPNP